MFIGNTPPEIRLLIQDILKERPKGEDIFVGCSGNFSTDKVLSGMGFKVHSNDVSLYSKTIADILLNQSMGVKIANSDLAKVFELWPDSPYKLLVQVSFAMRLAKFAPRNNQYQIDFYRNYIETADRYYANTVEKIERNKQLEFGIEDFSSWN